LALFVNGRLEAHLGGVDMNLPWHPLLQLGESFRCVALCDGWASSPPPAAVKDQLARVLHPESKPKIKINAKPALQADPGPLVSDSPSESLAASELLDEERAVPSCSRCQRQLRWSTVFPEGYEDGKYKCEQCREVCRGPRWFCSSCQEDVCPDCWAPGDPGAPVARVITTARPTEQQPLPPRPAVQHSPRVDDLLGSEGGRWTCAACGSVNFDDAPACNKCQRHARFPVSRKQLLAREEEEVQRGSLLKLTSSFGGGDSTRKSHSSTADGTPATGRNTSRPTVRHSKHKPFTRVQPSSSLCDGVGVLGTCDDVAVEATKGDELEVPKPERQSVCAF